MVADLGQLAIPPPSVESPRSKPAFGKLLKYFGIAFLAHFVFIVGYVSLSIYADQSLGLDELVFPYFVWPLFLLPIGGGGSHGGELFVSVISIPINSLIWAYGLSVYKRKRSESQPR